MIESKAADKKRREVLKECSSREYSTCCNFLEENKSDCKGGSFIVSGAKNGLLIITFEITNHFPIFDI